MEPDNFYLVLSQDLTGDSDGDRIHRAGELDIHG